MKIAILALNPCLDRTLVLHQPLAVGGNHRAAAVSEVAAGKGLNQAVVFEHLGTLCDYFSFGSQKTGDKTDEWIARHHFRYHKTPTACGVRVNIKIVDASGAGTEINEAGGPVTAAELEKILSDLDTFDGEIVSVCGSVPRGVRASVYRDVIARAKNSGKITVLDADGEALRIGLEACPDYIKPNRRELSELVGQKESDLCTDEAIRAAAMQIVQAYGTNVLCTMDADGSMYVGREGAFRVGAAKVEPRGFSGAGDTYLAAFLYARYVQGADVPAALSYAARASGAKVALEGTKLPTREQIDKVAPVSVFSMARN